VKLRHIQPHFFGAMKKMLWPFLLSGLLITGPFASAAESKAADTHESNSVLRSEHGAMLDLIKPTNATHIAVQNGAWSDSKTWKAGAAPVNDAVVLIPHGVTVVLDAASTARLRGMRLEGRLEFVTDHDTHLLVDTMVVTVNGELVVGSLQKPISAGHTARVTFIDRGPIDTAWDPKRMSRGLISHGALSVCGAQTTPYLMLAQPATAGATQLVFKTGPMHWKKGDQILVPGIRAGRGEDEVVTLLDVKGSAATIAPLAHDHTPPLPELQVPVANLSRNVVFDSENQTDIARLGHLMCMHSSDVSLYYAAFDHLGRTNKLEPINDVKVDDKGEIVSGTGTNVRGRYAVHFHRTGTDQGDKPVAVKGCVVTHAPGWGFVNHSSNVDFDGNVTFDVAGSGFVTEAGDEIGSFRRNLAVYSKGSGQDEDARRPVQDFGHEGDGFWFQGGGVTVEDNIATGQASSGFIFFTLGLIQEGLGQMRFSTANLWDDELKKNIGHIDHKDPDRINDADSVPVIFVPVKCFKRNTAVSCGFGYTTRFLQPQVHRSVYEDGLVWNCSGGVHVRYTSNFDLRNVRLIANATDKSAGAAIKGTDEGEQDIRYENLRVENWPIGILIPQAGVHHVLGGYYNNVRSIVVPTPLQSGRRVDIDGAVKFGTLEGAMAKRGEQFDVYMDPVFSGLLQGVGGYRDPNVLFISDITLMNGKQLYYAEQAASAVPFSSRQDGKSLKQIGPVAESLPAELIDRTTAQMARSYGLAIAGTVAPADAAPVARIHGLVGSRAAYGPEFRSTQLQVASGKDYRLSYSSAAVKQATSDASPVDLRNGWNLLTRDIEGARHSFIVFVGEGGRGKKMAKNDAQGAAYPGTKPKPTKKPSAE